MHNFCSDQVKQCDLLVSFLTRILCEQLNLVCKNRSFLNAQICFVCNINANVSEIGLENSLNRPLQKITFVI